MTKCVCGTSMFMSLMEECDGLRHFWIALDATFTAVASCKLVREMCEEF